jgi:hypothetical protein
MLQNFHEFKVVIMGLDKITFVDIFAVFIAVVCFYLLHEGIDSTVSAILLSVVSFYFGKKQSKE